MTTLDDLTRRTDEIREKYPHYWRDEQAQRSHLELMRQAVADLLRQPSLF